MRRITNPAGLVAEFELDRAELQPTTTGKVTVTVKIYPGSEAVTGDYLVWVHHGRVAVNGEQTAGARFAVGNISATWKAREVCQDDYEVRVVTPPKSGTDEEDRLKLSLDAQVGPNEQVGCREPGELVVVLKAK